ncbi:hypothetical protein QTH91_05855 [Variovorax dokdonensis]|uniref:Uncharacterized protein n=1 Tax=Variovorax dokdonensis TaxID=344883 RepID=A0ABT7N7U6_9BURK|nr:hypothetical protein [Variovorax dokdonensis]MDM0043998.1 hypothetical protein [Variovorax dokdonensis]
MRRKLNGLHTVGLKEYGPIPSNPVTSLDQLRPYVAPQAPQVAAADPMNSPEYWQQRAVQEQLVLARGTFVRFTSILNALLIPDGCTESRLRDDLLSLLAEHGYTKA